MPPTPSALRPLPPKSTNGKRKASHPAAGPAAKKPRFNANMRDVRTLLTQPASTAFANGELDVDKFVRAREFEIHALERGMRDARKGRHRRAFQEVPRELRRRTAAHDVKRVPKRFRQRARKEMLEDSTPTVNSRTKELTPRMRLRVERAKRLKGLNRNTKRKRKEEKKVEDEKDLTVARENSELESGGKSSSLNEQIKSRKPRLKTIGVLKKPPVPTSRFRKRQIHKSWLPTHIFHTKRAHMTPASAPLWRFAVPLSPTEKSYRSTHRSSQTRGAIAWDASYVSTIGLSGVETSIRRLLTALGIGIEDELWDGKKVGRRWISGTRGWEGWAYEKDSRKPIAPVTIIWCAEEKPDHEIGSSKHDANDTAGDKKPPKRKAIIRVHPSAFLQLWEEIIKLSRLQRPTVTVEDLRFEIGSVEITGPSSTEALVGCLWPLPEGGSPEPDPNGPADILRSLVSLSNLAVLPKNVLLPLTVSDPRLHHPPRPVQVTNSPNTSELQTLQHLLVEWPLDANPSFAAIFSRSSRLKASRLLSSQSAINRRKSKALPGQFPEPLPTDPQIPVLLYISTLGANTKWTVLAPWKAISPIWNHLMHQPLSTGGVPRFGGLNETKQVTFEAGSPWFPGDYPGMKAGFSWEETERKRRVEEWERRPKGKKTAWDSLDLGEGRKGEIGNGLACDWVYLLSGDTGGKRDQTKRNDKESANNMDIDRVETEDESNRDTQFVQPQQIPSSVARQILEGHTAAAGPPILPANAITTVRISLLTRGTASPCARIYRLPSKLSLKRKWMSLIPGMDVSKSTKQIVQRNSNKSDRHSPTTLAAVLLNPPQIPAGSKDYPVVPHDEDLIGFVTTASFTLSEGRATGIGSVALTRITEVLADGEKTTTKVSGHGLVPTRQICIVRNAGESLGRLARWELV